MRTYTITTHLFVYGGMYTYTCMYMFIYVFMQPGTLDVSAHSYMMTATRVALSRFDRVVCWHLWDGGNGISQSQAAAWFDAVVECSQA